MTVQDDGGSGPCTCAPCQERAKRLPARTAQRLERLDLTKPPAPVLRYTGILLIALIYCGLGAPTVLGDWLWAAVLVGFLVLPDVTGFAIGGIRLDLKQTQNDVKRAKDDIMALRNEVNARATAAATLAIGNDAIAALTQALARAATQAANDQASGAAVRWTPPGSGTRAGQDITS